MSRTQRSDAGEAGTRGPSVSSQALYSAQWLSGRVLDSRVVVCLTQDQGVAGSNLTDVTVLCP